MKTIFLFGINKKLKHFNLDLHLIGGFSIYKLSFFTCKQGHQSGSVGGKIQRSEVHTSALNGILLFVYLNVDTTKGAYINRFTASKILSLLLNTKG